MPNTIRLLTIISISFLYVTSAHAVIFDCLHQHSLDIENGIFTIGKVKFSTKYTVDTDSGVVVGSGRTWHYKVVQRGDANKGNDWVLVYLPELAGPYLSPEDVLREVPHLSILRIRVWQKGNPFRLDWGGMVHFGNCTPRF